MTEDDSTNKIGKYFGWIAWLLAMGLLYFVFQSALEAQWNPNQDPDTQISQTGLNEVHLKQNKHGHYITVGEINGKTVIFLLDTGATDVSIPAQVADKLNLTKMSKYQVSTANGNTTVYGSSIKELNIGDISLYNVEANINPSMQGDEILLGMSALKQLEFHQSGKTLILREQY